MFCSVINIYVLWASRIEAAAYRSAIVFNKDQWEDERSNPKLSPSLRLNLLEGIVMAEKEMGILSRLSIV